MGVGVVLKIFVEITLTQFLRIKFKVTNNQVEYEVVLTRLGFVQRLRAKHLIIYFDLQLIVNQINSDYEIQDETL